MRITLTDDEAALVRTGLRHLGASGHQDKGECNRLAERFTPKATLTATLAPATDVTVEFYGNLAAGEMVPTCPDCGGQVFGYSEGLVDYRSPDKILPGSCAVAVYWSSDGVGDSGDNDPGLFCDDWRGDGCGAPIDLPDDWEIAWS